MTAMTERRAEGGGTCPHGGTGEGGTSWNGSYTDKSDSYDICPPAYPSHIDTYPPRHGVGQGHVGTHDAHHTCLQEREQEAGKMPNNLPDLVLQPVEDDDADADHNTDIAASGVSAFVPSAAAHMTAEHHVSA